MAGNTSVAMLTTNSDVVSYHETLSHAARSTFVPLRESSDLMTTSSPDEEPFSPLLVTSLYSTGASQNNIFTSERVAAVYLVIGAVGITTNTFVLVVMSLSPPLRKYFINLYIMNQSASDLVVSLVLTASYRLDSSVPFSGTTGEVFCLLWQSRVLLWASFNVSTYNLVMLSLERYSEILHPVWHKLHVSRKGILVSIAVLWVAGFAFELASKLPPTVVVDGKCMLLQNWPSQTAQRAYALTVVIVKFVLPLVIMVYAYGRIAVKLHRKLHQTTSGAEPQLQRGKRNTIKTLVIVAVMFTLCWVSNQIIFFLFNMGVHINLFSDFTHFTIIAIYFNCCCNPFIYALKYGQFQAASRRLCFVIIGNKPSSQVADTASTEVVNNA